MRREKGSGSIYKRDGSPVWWIKYHRHGRPFRESTHTTDWNKAGKMLKTRLSEINQGTFMGPKLERTKVDELAVMFVRRLPHQQPEEPRGCRDSLESASKAVLRGHEGH